MKEILVWAIISTILFFGFLLTFIFGFTKKKRMYFFYAIGIFVLFGCTSAMTVYKFASKSYNKVTNTFKPRTGEEIYAALFGKPENDCVKIINYQDQIIPKIDYAIWLQFGTCPKELERILSQAHYEVKKEATYSWDSSSPLAGATWWKPESMGDTVLVYYYPHADHRRSQQIFVSLDSTEVYYVDVAD